MSRPNWFIGLPVEPGRWFPPPSPPPRVRIFTPADLHLTIAFLGGASEEAARRAWDALEWPLGATTVTLGDVVPMGNPRRPSALSAELTVGREAVAEAIAASRGDAFAAADARPDARSPRPHVTLARPRRKASAAERRAAVEWAQGLDLGRPRVTLDRLALYTWSADRKERLFRMVDSRSVS